MLGNASVADSCLLAGSCHLLLSPYRRYSLIIVATGDMTVHSETTSVKYGAGECLGTLRLVRKDCPFTKIEISSDTHLIKLPWDTIAKLVEESDEFLDACMKENGQLHRRFGPL